MALNDKMVGQLEKLNTHKQDKQIPFLINIHDGRLVPNNKITAANPDYRPYTGPLDASLPQRMALLTQSVGTMRTRVIASAPIVEPQTFDVSKATKDELASFAYDTYGLMLDTDVHLATLRKQVKDHAEMMEKAAETLT